MKQSVLILLAVLAIAGCGKKPSILLPRAVPAGQERLYPRAYPAVQEPPPVSPANTQ